MKKIIYKPSVLGSSKLNISTPNGQIVIENNKPLELDDETFNYLVENSETVSTAIEAKIIIVEDNSDKTPVTKTTPKAKS